MAFALAPPRICFVCSDAELIQRTGAGDRPAFEKLYKRYARPVFGLALRRLGDRGRAEDAVQETFASIWRSASTYKPERGPGAPWLYGVARNAIVDRSRARNEPPAEAPDGHVTMAPTSGPKLHGCSGESSCTRTLPERERG
jgi:RNA polymerase sigma-70 factor (ECF subfamily)